MNDRELAIARITELVGGPERTDDISLLWDLAKSINDLPSQSRDLFDYGGYQVETDWDDILPIALAPVKAKRGRPEKPKRKFLRHFFNAVEYILSESICWRVGARNQNLSDCEKFEAFNQVGKLAFLIACEFYPDITIDGVSGDPNDTGDVVALLRPKKEQQPFNATLGDLKNETMRKQKFEQAIFDAIEAWGEERMQELIDKNPRQLEKVRQVFEKFRRRQK